jgi:hypothetical protein
LKRAGTCRAIPLIRAVRGTAFIKEMFMSKVKTLSSALTATVLAAGIGYAFAQVANPPSSSTTQPPSTAAQPSDLPPNTTPPSSGTTTPPTTMGNSTDSSTSTPPSSTRSDDLSAQADRN